MMPGSTKEALRHCPLCGSADFSTEIESRDFESNTGSYRVENCHQCDLRFTNPRPTSDARHDLYRSRESADYVRPQRITATMRALAIRRWIQKVTRHSGPCEFVLDYGCGDGFFSVQLSRCPLYGHIMAVDLHDRPPLYLTGQDAVRYRSYEGLQREGNRFQLIFCRHVIEHIPDPVAVPSGLGALLAPGGTLVVEVPNYRSVWRKLFGRYYFGLYLPRHLLHFDEKTLKALFRDFHPETLYRNHTPVLGRSLGYLTGLAIGNLGLVGLGLYPLQVLADRLAQSSSVLSLVLRKRER